MSNGLYISLFSLAFAIVVVGFVFLRFSSKRDIMNFRVMVVRDIELRTCLSKNILILRFLARSKVKVCKCLFAQYR